MLDVNTILLYLQCAIDYTGSNGVPTDPRSLHYLHPSGQLNQYGSAIKQISSVVEFYDSDKLFEVWGFGGKPSPTGPVEHCFPVNGNEGNPQVLGCDGILQAYYASLKTVQLFGPTLFAPVINQAAAIAASTQTTVAR
jgi:copine 5/8/9